jgi:hypothetical protein
MPSAPLPAPNCSTSSCSPILSEPIGSASTGVTRGVSATGALACR